MLRDIIDYFGYRRLNKRKAIVIPYSEVHCETKHKGGMSLDVEIIITLEILPESDALDIEQAEWFNSLDSKHRSITYPEDNKQVRYLVEEKIKKIFYKSRNNAWEN